MAGMPLYQLLGGRSRDGVMVYGHANGSDIAETVDAVGAVYRHGLQGDPRADRRARACKDAYGVGRGKLYYEPADAALPSETGWDTRKYAQLRAQAVREAARDLRLRPPPAARRAPSLDADRGRAARQGARALPAVLAGGPDPGREPGSVQADPPAHHHAAGRRRDLQHDLGLPRT